MGGRGEVDKVARCTWTHHTCHAKGIKQQASAQAVRCIPSVCRKYCARHTKVIYEEESVAPATCNQGSKTQCKACRFLQAAPCRSETIPCFHSLLPYIQSSALAIQYSSVLLHFQPQSKSSVQVREIQCTSECSPERNL